MIKMLRTENSLCSAWIFEGKILGSENKNVLYDDKTLQNFISLSGLKTENKYEKIYVKEILYIRCLQNYVTFLPKKTKYITLLSLKTIEENLDITNFIRVKSCIVSLSKIETIENNELIIKNNRIPINRNLRDSAIEKLLKTGC